ncbi:hypothetical protein [Desulfoplanes sp.]
MKKIRGNGLKWVKTFHMFFACLWGGGAMGLVILQLAIRPLTGDALHMRDLCIKVIDDYIIVSGAFGCMATGIIFALFTSWGFFKHKWVIVKWIVNIGFIIAGYVYFIPWINHAEKISNNMRLTALQDAEYLHTKTLNLEMAVFQIIIIFVMIFISVFKPWIKNHKTSSTSNKIKTKSMT